MKIILRIVLVILWGQSLFAQGKVFFDVKCKLLEKPALFHIQLATEAHLIRSDWAGITPYGNDYVVWLKEYSKKEDGINRVTRLTVELRTSQMIGEGKLLASRKIDVSYTVEKDHHEVESAFGAIMRQLKNDSHEIETEAATVAEEITDATHTLVVEVRKQ